MQSYIMSGVPDSYQEKSTFSWNMCFVARRCLLHSFLQVIMYNSPEILNPGEGHRNVVHRRLRSPDQGIHRCGGGIFSIVLCGACNAAPQEGEGMSINQSVSVADKRVYTVEEIANMLRISRTAAYELVKKAEFAVIRSGGWIRVPRASFDAWLDGRGTR